jgi:GINS complex subunit 1
VAIRAICRAHWTCPVAPSCRFNAWRTRQQASATLLPPGLDNTDFAQVQHAKRTQNLAHLPPYQTELVRAVASEVRDLDKDVTRMLEPFQGSFDPSQDPATACALLVDHLSMRRNKRCLLAYHRVRAEKLEQMCWDGKDVLEQQGQNGGDTILGADGNQSSLSPEEQEYFRQYNDMLAAYKGQWTDIDLTGSLEPPKDLFIDVRVLKDAGEIQTEYG